MTEWQQALMGPNYSMLATSASEIPDTFDTFIKMYYPQYRDPEAIKADRERKAQRQAEIEQAKREAAEIVSLDKARAAKLRELSLDP